MNAVLDVEAVRETDEKPPPMKRLGSETSTDAHPSNLMLRSIIGTPWSEFEGLCRSQPINPGSRFKAPLTRMR